MTPFVWPVRVYYEDTDAAGVVFYANYLRFMERARTEWLRSLGFEQDELLREHGVLFVVRHANLRFRRPARFNDALLVDTALVRRGKASLEFRQRIVRPDTADEELCHGEIGVACLNARRFCPAAMPDALLTKIQHGS